MVLRLALKRVLRGLPKPVADIESASIVNALTGDSKTGIYVKI
jgi:hypothetical protein